MKEAYFLIPCGGSESLPCFSQPIVPPQRRLGNSGKTQQSMSNKHLIMSCPLWYFCHSGRSNFHSNQPLPLNRWKFTSLTSRTECDCQCGNVTATVTCGNKLVNMKVLLAVPIVIWNETVGLVEMDRVTNQLTNQTTNHPHS